MKIDLPKMEGLFSRVYNNKMNEHDGNDISEYIKRVFQSGENPDPSTLHQFNNLLVKTADEVFKAKKSNIIEMIANYKKEKKNTAVKYNVPQQTKTKFVWSANGSGVDLKRVSSRKSHIAVAEKFQTGIYYEPLSGENAVEEFKDAVNSVAEAKVKLYLDAISALIQKSITSGQIPSGNVITQSNITLADYSQLASKLQRFGGRPIFIGDSLLIDYFAMQQTSGTTEKLLYDDLKQELLTSLNPTTIGRTTAVNLLNPFTDTQNTKTEYPVNVGYMFAGEAGKPFYITEFGGLTQFTEQDPEDERIKIKLTQEADISLFYGQTVGYIKEDAAVSL